MKKNLQTICLIILLITFILLFKYSNIVTSSVTSSMELWYKRLVPSMLPIYLILDLLINYGLINIVYKIFKNNTVLLFLISLVGGTPTNAKYIKEFYMDGFITIDSANLLLSFAYSPSPLFIFTIAPSVKLAIITLSYIYLTDIIIYFIFKNKLKNTCNYPKSTHSKPFIEALSNSIDKSFKTLILILGIVIFFGVINSFINTLGITSPFIYSLLELTNALNFITTNRIDYLWFMFASSFAGLSIHTQIKSIIEDTPLSYRYFLYGRLIASIPIIVFIIT